jgi:hypothetical protein
MTFHNSRFELHIVSMVQLGCHGPLDCIYNLSSGWKGYNIRILADYEKKKGTRILKVVCDSK